MKTKTFMNRLIVLIVILGCFVFIPYVSAQSPPNTITFDNQSGEFREIIKHGQYPGKSSKTVDQSTARKREFSEKASIDDQKVKGKLKSSSPNNLLGGVIVEELIREKIKKV